MYMRVQGNSEETDNRMRQFRVTSDVEHRTCIWESIYRSKG